MICIKSTRGYILLFLLFLFFPHCKRTETSIEAYSAPVFPKKSERIVTSLNDSFVFDAGRINLTDNFIVCSGKTEFIIANSNYHQFIKTNLEDTI